MTEDQQEGQIVSQRENRKGLPVAIVWEVYLESSGVVLMVLRCIPVKNAAGDVCCVVVIYV